VSMDSRFARGTDRRDRAPIGEGSSSGGELLHLPVCVNGAELGRPTDLLVDLDRLRVVGINVRCNQGAERFLPLAAAELAGERINAVSSLALLDESAYYGKHGASLRSLRGAAVDLGGRSVGSLADIVLRADGEVTRVVVRGESGRLRRLGAKHVRIGRLKAARG
jgi:sporulation protein YlmC with PRC-barrel domain